MTTLATKPILPDMLTAHARNLADLWRREVEAVVEEQRQHPLTKEPAEIFGRYAGRPGKLLRPALLLAGHNLYHPAAAGWVFRLAIALEWLHLGLLIQDDIMDRSRLRRGRPTLHIMYEEWHLEQGLVGGRADFAAGLAVLMSDICFNRAEQIWTEVCAEQPAARGLKIHFDRLKQGVYGGQHLDLLLPAAVWPPDRPAIMTVMQEKTARYTAYYPLLLGALAAGQAENKLAWLADYALNLGVAFQITDDVLGTFGRPEETGKANHEDIRQRKQTLLVWLAFTRANRAQQKMLSDFYRFRRAVPVAQIKSILRETESAKRALAEAAELCRRSRRALDRSGLSPDGRRRLEQLADFIAQRQY